jgi:hypothetical protein
VVLLREILLLLGLVAEAIEELLVQVPMSVIEVFVGVIVEVVTTGLIIGAIDLQQLRHV